MNVEQRAHNLAIREHLVQENMTKCMNIVGRTRWMLNQLQGVAEDFASDKDDEVRQAAKDTLLGRLSNEMRLLEDLFDQSHRA